MSNIRDSVLAAVPEDFRQYVEEDGGINCRPMVFYENTPNRAYVELQGSFSAEFLEWMAAYIRLTQDRFG